MTIDGVAATCGVTLAAAKLGSLWKDEVLSNQDDVSALPLVVYYDQNRIGGLTSSTFRSARKSNRGLPGHATRYASRFQGLVLREGKRRG